jgi:hypothetical protein
MVGLYAKASKKMDLSHFWQQHILMGSHYKGRYRKGYNL